MRYNMDDIRIIINRMEQIGHELMYLYKVLPSTDYNRLAILLNSCYAIVRNMPKEIPECNRRGKKTMRMTDMEKELAAYVAVLDGELLCATLMV